MFSVIQPKCKTQLYYTSREQFLCSKLFGLKLASKELEQKPPLFDQAGHDDANHLKQSKEEKKTICIRKMCACQVNNAPGLSGKVCDYHKTYIHQS